MKDKYVVEIGTDTGLAAFCTAQIAAVLCNNSDLLVYLTSAPMLTIRYRIASHAEDAYKKILTAVRAVA